MILISQSLLFSSWLYNPIMNLSFNFKVKRSTVIPLLCVCVCENTCMQVEAWASTLSPTFITCLPAVVQQLFHFVKSWNPEILSTNHIRGSSNSLYWWNRPWTKHSRVTSSLWKSCELQAVTALMRLHTLSFQESKWKTTLMKLWLRCSYWEFPLSLKTLNQDPFPKPSDSSAAKLCQNKNHTPADVNTPYSWESLEYWQ